MKRLISFLALASACFGQYVATPRTLTDAEVGLILQTPVTSGGQTYAATGQYAIGFVVANPNGISPYTGASALPSTSILGMHGVGQQWALGNEHVGGYDLPTELAAYEAAEVAAGRGKLFVTSGGNPVYYDNSGFPYGKRPINVCDPRFVRFMANEQMRRRMLSPSNPGGAQSPQYPMLWQSWDEGFYLYSVYGFPGGTGDGSTWDAPFPQNQGQYTACVASYYAQLYAIAPDVFITLNQGSLAEANGTVNNNDLTLFQQIYNSSPNLNIDTENFLSPGTSTTATQTFFNRVQNITGWLSTTGRTAMYRGVIDGTAGQMQSNALAYLIAKEGNSFFSEGQNSLEIDPNNATYPWASIFDEMGTPTSAYSTIACTAGGSDYSNKVLERQYEGGIVYYNNCTSTQTITLPGGTWYDSTGTPQTSLTILSYASGVDSAVAQYVTNANYTVTPIVQPPQITPLGNGTITGSVTATITDGTSGATICYTTDGSMPTASAGTCIHGSTYSTALTISTTTTLTAIASHTGDANSWERATTFTITGTNPNVQTVVLNDATTPFFPLTYVALVLSNPSAAALTVNYTVTCDANITCSPSSGTATFAAFQTAIAVPVTVTLGSTTAADTMLFTVTSGTGYTVGAQSTYTLTVKRDFLPAVTNQYTEIHASSWGQGRSDLPTDNQNTGTTITAGVIPTTPATFRTAWKFDLSSVPSTATVTKATMLGYSPTNTDTGYAITAATCAAGVGTVTIGSNPLAIGQTVLITGSTSTGTGYNSTAGVVITATPSNQISYAIPSCTNTTWVSGGTVFTMLYPTSVYRATTGFTQSTVDWNNYFINGTVCSGGPCWAASPSATNYQTPGNSINGNTTGVLTITNSANHYDLTTDTQNIVNSTNPNNGWVMTSSESAAHRETFAWYTSAAANPPPESPSLLVQYNTPASCTVSVTSPTASQTVTVTPQFRDLNLTVAAGNCPALYAVEYFNDGDSLGRAYASTSYSLKWNAFNDANGPHVITAIGYDAVSTDAALATSAPVSFTLANTQTYSSGTGTYNATISVTPSCTSNCSGNITLTLSIGGTFSTAAMTIQSFIDGAPMVSATCGSPCTVPPTSMVVDTRNFLDGSHAFRITASQGSENQVASWQQAITTQNGSSVPVETLASAAEVFLVPTGPTNNCGGGSTCTLTATVLNADGSTVSSPTIDFFSLNTAVATVGLSSGAIAIVGSTPNSVQVAIMPEITSGTFSISGVSTQMIGSFRPSNEQPYSTGAMFRVTGGAGCTTGFHFFNSAGTASATSQDSVGTVGSSGCTYVTGPTTFVWVDLNSANAVPHFLRNGTISTSTSDPSYSILWRTSQFNTAGSGNAYTNYFTDFTNGGWNTYEIEDSTAGAGAMGATSQATYTNAQNSYVSSNISTAQSGGIYLLLISDPWWRSSSNLFDTTRNQSALSGIGAGTWSPANIGVMYTAWANANTSSNGPTCTPSLVQKCFGTVTGGRKYDEVNSTYAGNPYYNVNVGFAYGNLTGISSTGSSCTATWSNWQIGATQHFVISGATTTGFNSVSPNVYTYTSISSSQFSFPCTVAAGSYSSSTDPTLILEPFADAWRTNSGSTSDYVHIGAFTQVANAANLVSGRPLFAWANSANTSQFSVGNWLQIGVSDYNELYQGTGTTALLYSLTRSSLYTIIHDIGSTGPNTNVGYRYFFPSFQDQKPWSASNTEAITAYYTFAGYPLTVTGTSGNTITVSQPHGLYNVIPGVSRVQLSSMSVSADNTTVNTTTCTANCYKVISSPKSTTLTLYTGTTIVSVPISSGKITFSNGDSYTTGLQVQSQANPNGQIFQLNDTASGCVIPHHRGMTFTFSLTGTAWDFGTNPYTYYYDPTSSPDTPCTSNIQGRFFQIPSFTSTSGTATITPDNYPHRGLSNIGTNKGPLFIYVSHAYPAILGASALTSYPAGQDEQFWNPATGAFSTVAITNSGKYNDYGDFGNAVQEGLYAPTAIGDSKSGWYGASVANLQNQGKAKWWYQAPLAAPYIGSGFECGARGGALGDFAACQSFWNVTTTMTIPTTPYLQSGQAFIQDVCTYLGCTTSSVASGTSSVSVACLPGCTVYLRFPTNAAAEWAAPLVSARLADVTNATDVVVLYAYTPFPMSAPTGQGGISSVDCGTGLLCSIPVDTKVGSIYYRILYRSATGASLALSDVQVIAQTQ